jgi:NAD(P)-dependent dehydrogenase (short-subunit alcohol dehydrogenase family)
LTRPVPKKIRDDMQEPGLPRPVQEPGLPRKLAGKVALVTGGTSGIGAATATLFAAEGANVVVTGRRTGLGEKTVKTLVKFGVRGAYVEADHTKLEDCERSVSETVRQFGRIDILFNNAGVVMRGTAESTSEEDWASLMKLNLTAVWRMSRLVLPHMRAQGGGVIVNNASDWGVVGAENALAYAVSKAAVVQLTRCMALDHAAENIRVNAVCPGDTFVQRWIEKGYFEAADPVTLEQAKADAASGLPMGRFGQPEEIARAVLFLASTDSSFMTGQTLVVDGGNTAR